LLERGLDIAGLLTLPGGLARQNTFRDDVDVAVNGLRIRAHRVRLHARWASLPRRGQPSGHTHHSITGLEEVRAAACSGRDRLRCRPTWREGQPPPFFALAAKAPVRPGVAGRPCAGETIAPRVGCNCIASSTIFRFPVLPGIDIRMSTAFIAARGGAFSRWLGVVWVLPVHQHGFGSWWWSFSVSFGLGYVDRGFGDGMKCRIAGPPQTKTVGGRCLFPDLQ